MTGAPERSTAVHPARALALPLAFTGVVLALGHVPSAERSPALLGSFWGAAALLLAWSAALLVAALRRGRSLRLEVVVRSQHWVQACAQGSVLAYWGWYWPRVYESAHLIAAQLAFAYAVDALLAWSRRDTWTLGFGPFPVVFSINLFLWFKPDWFFLQFLLVALGFAAKELIRWEKAGRRAHVFNPSSFPLALFSLALILTGKTHLTWGAEIAYTQIYPPWIYLWIFLVALPGQLLFGVTLMTMSAVVTAYAWVLLYIGATGTGFFFETYIPIASFLGMHLLFSDPSTSPRSDLGRIAFGVLYGSSVVALYALLEGQGVPSFYDKLLAVPVLNAMIQGIDRVAGSKALKRFDPAVLLAGLPPRRRHLVYVSVWAVVFAVMQSVSGDDQELQRQNKRAFALLAEGRGEEALSHFRQAARIAGDRAFAHENLGQALLGEDRPEEAVAPLRRALKLRPDAETHEMLAFALAAAGEPGGAVLHFREAIRLRPDSPQLLTHLAWLRATHPDSRTRDPEEAIRLASRAAELSRGYDPVVLDTLAAAYASGGRFDEAVRTAEAALQAAASAPDLAPEIRARLELYRAGRPVIATGF